MLPCCIHGLMRSSGRSRVKDRHQKNSNLPGPVPIWHRPLFCAGVSLLTNTGNSYPYCDTHSADVDSQIDYSGGVFSVRTKGVRDMSDDPMVEVSWFGSAAYCNWRSSEEGKESCCNLSTWNDGVYPYTSPAGSFAANGYGLYDMAGNVWEWCNDWWSSDYYSSSPYYNPPGAASGTYRVIRGGAWNLNATYCRTTYRYIDPPSHRNYINGFRLVLDL